MNSVKRVALVVLYAIPPLFAALYAGATEIEDGSFTPWRANMVDLAVYRRSADLMLQGQDFYNVEAWLPFIYPPFAVLLAVPIALLGVIGSQVIWLILNGLMVMALVYRLGFSGWKLSIISMGAIWLIEPMRVTLGFGQVNIFLMCLVAYDLLPGPRVLGTRRLLPQGWLTGIATAIKLTPAIFAVYLFLSGKVKPAIVAFVAFVAATVIGWVVLPGPSMTFWGRLFAGDSGLNAGMKYYTNQSIIGSYIRFTQENPDKIPLVGIILAGFVCIIGVAAAVLWHRLGHESLAVSLTAITALLASPISWSHHFVWILPLAIILITDSKLPNSLRFLGLVFSVWVMYAPFMQLPETQGGLGDEFSFTLGQKLIDAGSVILGLGLFFLAIGLALVERRRAGLPWLPLTIREKEVPSSAQTGSAAATTATD